MPDPIETLYVEVAVRADQLIRDIEQAVKIAEDKLKRIGDATEEVEDKFTILGGAIATALGVGAVKAAQVFLSALRNVVGVVTGFVKQAINLTARVDVLGTVLEGVGRRAGYNAEQMAELETNVKSMGITTQAARQSLIMMAQANVDLAYASDLARIAQNAAVVAGINSSEAFERMIYALSRGRTEVMTTLGIMVNFVKVESQFAATLGKTRQELDDNERMQARFQGTLEASVAIQDAYTSAMEKAGKQMTSIPRYLEEIQLALGEAFQTAYTTLIFEVKRRLGELLEFLQDPATMQALDDFSAALDRVLKLLLELADGAAENVPKIVKFFREMAVGFSGIVWETEQAERNVDNLWESFKQLSTIMWAVAAGFEELFKSATIALYDLTAALLPLRATWQLLLGEISLAEWAAASDASLEKVKVAFRDTIGNVEQVMDEAFRAAGEFFGVVEEIPEVKEPRAPGAAPEVEEEEPFMLGEKAKKALAQGAAKIEAILKKFQKKIEKLQRDHAKKMIAIDKKEQEGLTKAWFKYYQATDKLQKKHQKQRSKATKDYQKERIRDQEDFNKRWKRLIRDQHQDVLDADWEFQYEEERLIAEGDTLALRDLRKRYDHEKEVRAREQQETRSDTQEDYQKQHEERRRDFQESQAERDAEFQERMLELHYQLQEQLRTVVESAIEARQKEKENLAERMADAQESRDEELQRIGEWLANVKKVSEEELNEIKKIWAEIYGEIADTAIEEGLRAHKERMRLLGLEKQAAEDLARAYAEGELTTGIGRRARVPRARGRTAPVPRSIPIGAQRGMDEIINRPTLLMVGEGGMPEHVQVTPLTGGGMFGMSGRLDVNVTVSSAGAMSPEGESTMIVVVANALKGAVEAKMEQGV